MAMLPIQNPPIPFVGLIPGGGLQIGSTVKIRAVISDDRIQINLQNGSNPVDLQGSNPLDDVMLHASIYPENCIVRNHFDKMRGWGSEEIYNGCPVKRNRSFEIVINCDAEHYRISINGKSHSTFVHRWPPTLARYISINGTCTVASITVDPPYSVHMIPKYLHIRYASAPPPYPGNCSEVPSYITRGCQNGRMKPKK